jgi:hypothetical protein
VGNELSFQEKQYIHSFVESILSRGRVINRVKTQNTEEQNKKEGKQMKKKYQNNWSNTVTQKLESPELKK